MEIPDRIARARANEQLKYKRRQYSDIFINKGQPGYVFKSKYESILSKLKLPQEYLDNEYDTQKKRIHNYMHCMEMVFVFCFFLYLIQ